MTERSLRSRLIAAYVAALLAALLIFAAVALVAIDRTARGGLDTSLSTAAQGISALLDITDGRIQVDPDDRGQFLKILGFELDGVVVDTLRGPVLANVSAPPAQVVALPAGMPSYFSTGSGERHVRAFVLPVRRDGALIGKIVVWRPDAWIAQTDRRAALAFAAAAIVIAVLALLVGGAVTRRALNDAFARQRRFTADASHELRAPLAVIRAEADLALRKPRDEDGYRRALGTIADEADRMEALIGDLLSVARAEAKPAVRGEVHAGALARRLSERISPAARARDVDIDVAVEEDARIAADAADLERALLAIAHNAVKYARIGGRVAIRVARKGDGVEITIADDGPGFSPDALEHAFDRFWRGDPASDRGSGLGLSIARSLVEAYDGEIVLTNVAEGAEVRVRLPTK
ncbi:MAG TPA: HAMP domain-containing sensor histidine kinase [Candidatus Baltobacteraceae bacterium]|nr:HAMP domain-containing sensor histidine kinase [Candidatus Baltobacteraceae bacterium]